MEETKKHKAGFVSILGNPNVGKSTLMNALVGANLSITTSKVQTTRHRIQGILNGDDFQVVFSDTPGIIPNPGYKLQQAMMSFVEAAIEDADVFLYMTTPDDAPLHEQVLAKVKAAGVPLLVLFNKIDLMKQAEVEQRLQELGELFPASEIIPVSALHRFNLEKVFEMILQLLPESPPFYPKDELSDKTMRFFVSEIIREKILLNFRKEIPYSVEVEVYRYKELPDKIDIGAYIYVMRESQKAIILGHRGSAIKRVGMQARKDIEEFVGRHVYLDLSVKVKKDWRDKEQMLKHFGYLS